MKSTLLLSTMILGAWTVAALAEPGVTTSATTPAQTKIATTQPAGRLELSDAQMDKLKAGFSEHIIFNNGNDFFFKEHRNSTQCHNVC